VRAGVGVGGGQCRLVTCSMYVSVYVKVRTVMATARRHSWGCGPPQTDQS
jgi:hypothetical protein